jgi:uncharacterized protein (DUF2132 family)
MPGEFEQVNLEYLLIIKTRMNTINTNPQPQNPLHGITLETMITRLVEKYGWLELSKRIPLRCFYHEPSIKSSLKFLRRTPWARKAVEDLFLNSIAARHLSNPSSDPDTIS